MAQYIFTPNANVLNKDLETGSYGSKLSFQKETKDYNYSPWDGSVSNRIDFTSVVKPGDYIYALTREGSNASLENTDLSERIYPLDELVACRVTDIKVIGETDPPSVQITLDRQLQAPVFGNQGTNVEFDYFLFDREFNKISEAKIGFDKKPAQLVESIVDLYDYESGQVLQDPSFNSLFTTEKTYFDESLKSINATSVVAGNTSADPLKVIEQFPTVSEVSSSLLGIPRAEEQLSLFSDVSTLGLDSDNWEYFSFSNTRQRVGSWEERKANTSEGERYSAKLIENVEEQAIELSTNTVPYTFPYNETDTSNYNEANYKKYKNFIILGNLLWLWASQNRPGTQGEYLDPAQVRWGIMGGDDGISDSYFQVHQFGSGITEEIAFRLIDSWTETWMSIKRSENGEVTEGFINSQILDVGVNESYRLGLISLYRELNEAQFGTNSLKVVNTEAVLSLHFQNPGLVYSETDQNGTQPGYLRRGETQQVILQSKETYRYQPGRISGFTFGSRCSIDKTSTANFAEWGCVNESDEYVFRLAGSQLSIVRRSTIPLTEQSLGLSGGFNAEDQIEFENVKPIIGGAVREKFYELEIPNSRWNGDPMDGNGPTGYKIDPNNVTMWKIEFSWYGAIGVQFYAYVPVGLGEARWVKLHRIIIENSLPQANLQDPYFRMRYNLVIGDRTVTTKPQFIYKYGSSVYVDGGDEGTKTVTTFISDKKVVPEDSDEPTSVVFDKFPQDTYMPMIGIQSKRFISNSEGILRPSRMIGIPESMTVTADELVEVDVLQTEAGKSFGFTYDNGLRWNPHASPGIARYNHNHTYADSAFPANHNSVKNEGGSDLSPYATRLFDFVFEGDADDATNRMYRLALTKPTGVTISTSTTTLPYGQGKIERDTTIQPKLYVKLDPTTDSPLMIDGSYDDAKIAVPGLNNCYVDWQATLDDTDITKVTGLDGRVLAAKFRVKRIFLQHEDTDAQDGKLRYVKIPITKTQNLFKAITTGGAKEVMKQNVYTGTNSGQATKYYSFAEPRIPHRKYVWGTDTSPGAIFGNSVASPSRNMFAEYLHNFRDSYGTLENQPFFLKDIDPTDPSSKDFPFKYYREGADRIYITKRGSFREYESNVSSAFCIPYSYGFGMTKLQRWDQAIATSDSGLVGQKITMRFLNPHATGVNTVHNIFNSTDNTAANPIATFKNRHTTANRYPEFRIGFTNRRPAKKTMDGTAQLPGENMQWNGTFESPGGEGFLDDKDFIFVDYNAKKVNRHTSGGEYINGEYNDTNAEKMQDDYRVKAVLNEAQHHSPRGYHIGGFPSYVRLEVAPTFSSFNGVFFFADFNGVGGLIQTFKGVNGSATTYSSGGLDLNGTEHLSKRVFFPDFPDSETSDGVNYAPATDFSSAGVTSGDNFIVVNDEQGLFTEAVDQGLSLKGGELIVNHNNVRYNTGRIVTSDPIKMTFWADGNGTIAGITSDFYNKNSVNAYIFQLDGALSITDSGGSAVIPDHTSKIEFKVVKLFHPDGENGTEEIEVQKVFTSADDVYYPVIKLREDAQINNINIRTERPLQPDAMISPVWKLYGAVEITKPISMNSPTHNRLLNSDATATLGTSVASSIPETFVDTKRLSGLLTNVSMNKILRKSISDPNFLVLKDDPAGVRRYVGSSQDLYKLNTNGTTLAERAKQLTSYYFGPEGNQSPNLISKEIPLRSTFGEDRNRIIPDQLGTEAIFVRAQKVNLDDVHKKTANVQVALNVSEI